MPHQLLADCLRRALISRDKGAAVHLIRRQRVDPLLQLVDDFADCRCLVARAIMHGASLPWHHSDAEGSDHARQRAGIRIRSCRGWPQRV